MGLDIYNSLFGKESYVLQKFHEKKAQIKTTYNAQGNKVISKYSRSGRLVYTKTFVDNTIRLEQYGEIEKDVFGRDTRKAKVTVYGADGVTTLSTEELIQTLGKHGELLEETNTLTGEITKYTYDENGNLIEKREYGSNGKLKHAYDKNGKEIYINDPYSNETDVAKNQFGKETKSEYDYMGNPVSTITTKNFGEYTEKTYEYYSSYETKKDGTTTRTCKRGSAWIRSDEKTYTPVEYTAYVQVLDGNNNVIKETNKADGSYVEFSYNNKGNVKQKVYYDKSGNLLYTEKINYFEKSLEEITKIDSDGNVTEKRVYSSATNRVNYWEAYKNYSTNSEGQVTRIATKSIASSGATANGVLTGETYAQILDENGNVVSETNLRTGKITVYEYDEKGNVTSKKTYSKTSTYDLDGIEAKVEGKATSEEELKEICSSYDQSLKGIALEYDQKGQIKKSELTYLEDGQTKKSTTEYNYDNNGQIASTKITIVALDDNGSIKSQESTTDVIYATDSTRGTTTVNQTTKTANAEEKISSTYYYDNNNNVTKVDSTSTVTDKQGNVQITDTKHEYYANGNVKFASTTIKDNNDNEENTVYKYDEDGKLLSAKVMIKQVSEDGNVITVREEEITESGERISRSYVERYENGKLVEHIEYHEGGASTRTMWAYNDNGTYKTVCTEEYNEDNKITKSICEDNYENGQLKKYTYLSYQNGIAETEEVKEYSKNGQLKKYAHLSYQNGITETEEVKEYNENGTIKDETSKRYDISGSLVNEIELVYSDNERVASRKEIQYHENGASVTTTEYDEEGNETVITEEYDKDGNLIIPEESDVEQLEEIIEELEIDSDEE